MSTNCFVHIWIPKNSTEDWGHYTLFIKGTIKLSGHEITNPVFSYRSDSKLYIFPKSQYANNYPINTWNGYEAWKYKIVASDTQLANFVSNINAASDIVEELSSKTLIVCTMKSGNKFSNYSRKKINSFAAVATWSKWLGCDVFYKRYNNVHNNAYKAYMPAKMLESSYASNWTETTFNG